jgi:hypothetical protein
LSRYLQPLDAARKKADSYSEYAYYFELVRAKIQQHEIEAQNMYNMDKKGFLIGVMNKTMRVFTRSQFDCKQLLGNTHDGNREWITTIACICADSTTLPPALIYKATSGNLQDLWVQDLDP